MGLGMWGSSLLSLIEEAVCVEMDGGGGGGDNGSRGA